jgi:hypothetical protein
METTMLSFTKPDPDGFFPVTCLTTGERFDTHELDHFRSLSLDDVETETVIELTFTGENAARILSPAWLPSAA